MYFPNGYKGESLNYCVLFIRFYQPFVVFNLINNMFHSFYRGVRASKLLMVSTLVNSVTRVLDYGEWYYLLFEFDSRDIYFVCQKSLLTKGSLEEFEALFEGKIEKCY